MGMWDRVRRLFASTEELTSTDRRRFAAERRADPIADVTDRERVRLCGTIEVLTIRPRRTRPWLEATMSDGTGRITLIWMGRHTIPGIDAGRDLIVEGRVSVDGGMRRMYNPRYHLL